MDKYLHDLQYADGKKSFTRYEYWHLFQMIKEPKKRRNPIGALTGDSACMTRKGKKSRGFWRPTSLAMAVAQGYFRCRDTKTLIDLKRKVNMVDSFNDGISITKTEVNPETIVANQLAMYIRAYNLKRPASALTSFPTPSAASR